MDHSFISPSEFEVLYNHAHLGWCPEEFYHLKFVTIPYYMMNILKKKKRDVAFQHLFHIKKLNLLMKKNLKPKQQYLL